MDTDGRTEGTQHVTSAHDQAPTPAQDFTYVRISKDEYARLRDAGIEVASLQQQIAALQAQITYLQTLASPNHPARAHTPTPTATPALDGVELDPDMRALVDRHTHDSAHTGPVNPPTRTPTRDMTRLVLHDDDSTRVNTAIDPNDDTHAYTHTTLTEQNLPIPSFTSVPTDKHDPRNTRDLPTPVPMFKSTVRYDTIFAAVLDELQLALYGTDYAPPRLLTPQNVQTIMTCVQGGMTRHRACAIVGISQHVYRTWRSRAEDEEEPYATFFMLFDMAEARTEAQLIASWSAHARISWQAAQALARARFPDWNDAAATKEINKQEIARMTVDELRSQIGAERAKQIEAEVRSARALPAPPAADASTNTTNPIDQIAYRQTGMQARIPDDGDNDDGNDANPVNRPTYDEIHLARTYTHVDDPDDTVASD